MRRLALVVLVSVGLAACSVGPPPDDATGAEIYMMLCANCHGDDLGGGLGPAIGPGSSSVSEPDEFLEFTILRGRGRMPSFSSSLEESQVNLLVTYIREVQGE